MNDDVFAGYTQVECEKKFKSDGIMHTGKAPFRMRVKLPNKQIQPIWALNFMGIGQHRTINQLKEF